MEIMNPAQVRVAFDMEEVHRLSMDLLQSLEEGGVPLNLSTISLAMSLGRLMTPTPMDQVETGKFIQAILDFGGAYFVRGSVN